MIWAFLGVNGSLSSLCIEPEYRGRGLMKAVTRKLLRTSLVDSKVHRKAPSSHALVLIGSFQRPSCHPLICSGADVALRHVQSPPLRKLLVEFCLPRLSSFGTMVQRLHHNHTTHIGFRNLFACHHYQWVYFLNGLHLRHYFNFIIKNEHLATVGLGVSDFGYRIFGFRWFHE